MFVVGRITTIYVEEKSPVGNEAFLWSVWRWSALYGVGFLLAFIVEYTQHYLHMWSTERIMSRCRRKFIAAILSRQSSDFETSSGELGNRLSNHIDRMRDGLGDKMGIYFSTFIVSTTASFILDWQTTLLMAWAGPLYILLSTLLPKLSEKSTNRGLAVAEVANGVAVESIVNFKTVASCNGQGQMIQKYSSLLQSGVGSAVRIATSSGLLEAASNLVYNVSTCAGLWFATISYHNGRLPSAGTAFTVVYMSLMSAHRLTFLGPHLISLLKARAAAAKVYEVIDSTESDSMSTLDPSKRDMHVEFRNVSFSYPSRASPAINSLSFELQSGKSLALVGKSGCGKSTTLKLLTKFLKAASGSVLIDGVPLDQYDTRKWRQMIGVVSQEPCLFSGSIRENICLGREFSHDQVIAACKIAHAHEFIVALDKGYETLIGASGVSLSGGQKQRIGIARAIVSNPRLLLLDEATSALDTKSERIVQRALDDASLGRSTIVVAHRLSTIKNVDAVVVMADGAVVESGDYTELRSRAGGVFAKMVAEQDMQKAEETPSTSSEDSFEAIQEQQFPSVTGGLFALLARHKFKTFLVVLLGILKGVGHPLLSVRFFFLIGSLEEDNYETLLVWLVVGTMSVAIYHFIVQLISQPICQYIGETVMNDMRVASLSSLLHRPAAYFDRRPTSPSACSVLLSQQPPLAMALIDNKLSVVVDSIFASFSIICVAFAFCLPNGLVGMLYIISYLLLLVVFERFHSRANEALVETDTSGELAVEIFENVATIQQLAVENHFQEKYDQIQRDRQVPLADKVKWQTIIHATNESIFMIFDCIATSVGVYFVFRGDYSTKQLFTTECLVAYVGWLTFMMSTSLKEMVTASSSAKLLFGLIDPTLTKKDTAEPGYEAKGSLRGEDLSFAYPSQPNRQVLSDVSFNVDQGKSLAMVGPSGGGKSTIVNLLERFYEPSAGKLMLDDAGFSSITHRQLRSNIALVSQEPILFRGTIADNVLLGVENASDEDVKRACQLANAFEFIQDLPEGYETLVGEKGRSLSGGQKQRIAIARALVRNPKVIVLDEATSALDTQSEKVVRSALESSARGRTSVSIAHRLDTIRHCDEIVFVEGGRIVERGSHEELMAKRGKYYEMTEQQRL
ncbi:hypothetical protein PFISCL1PPCAC_13660, partial [Pristionchus fissidentatus]